MKDEIKEILDNPKILMLSYGNYISLDDYVKLKDYITNLQEELKSANESISWWQNRFNAVEKENKKLKETNIYCNRTDCSGRIKDSRKYDSVYQEKEDYKTRNEKAIEYIKWNLEANEELIEYFNFDANFNKLLDILQGGDK